MSRAGVVIVGASVAGTRVARDLRQNGYKHAVTVLEAEPHTPYDKPPLSKAWLKDEEDLPVPLLTPAEARDLEIDLHLGVRVSRIRAEVRAVDATDGSTFAFEHLVIATGASARPSPWTHPCVHVLRTLDDAVAVRKALETGHDLVVIGAGFIGSEVASAARERGLGVTMVDPLPIPMARLLGEEIGGRIAQLHRRNGVDTRFGVGVEEIQPVGEELVVRLDDGAVLKTASVVVGIGTELDVNWLEESGLKIEDGVVCDEYGRSHAYHSIYAVGDIARWFHPRHGKTTRAEHWTSAVDQAACVAWNISNPSHLRALDAVEYVWSDQFDWKMHILGCPDPLRQPTVVEDAESGKLAAIWTSGGGEVCGAFTVNWSKASIVLRRAISAGAAGADLVDVLTPVPEVAR